MGPFLFMKKSLGNLTCGSISAPFDYFCFVQIGFTESQSLQCCGKCEPVQFFMDKACSLRRSLMHRPVWPMHTLYHKVYIVKCKVTKTVPGKTGSTAAARKTPLVFSAPRSLHTAAAQRTLSGVPAAVRRRSIDPRVFDWLSAVQPCGVSTPGTSHCPWFTTTRLSATLPSHSPVSTDSASVSVATSAARGARAGKCAPNPVRFLHPQTRYLTYWPPSPPSARPSWLGRTWWIEERAKSRLSRPRFVPAACA